MTAIYVVSHITRRINSLNLRKKSIKIYVLI
jgi:hypothetical protein